ncbi:hypothetical protein LOZ53_004704 [Ophidiomyces ophidiicola]|nr:hypothetical protein LOZ55_000662 [Ophidiomyces ophidiicola]KAI1985163.1 hypothetical protein LOZ54_004283 [Ophidiomyces ophidiicola]KAI1986355.1 hypothetical protein LOZ53_004704 [Ophidiomyces ophidiicola]KAI1998647.1 hypothetical protein LOZ51_002381 [Ophidiomyces ophidiicola]
MPLKAETTLKFISVPQQAVQSSAYDGFEPPLPESRECQAVETLLTTINGTATYNDLHFTNFLLEDFTIYNGEIPTSNRYGMVGLQDISLKGSTAIFLFDGIVKPDGVNGPAFYLKRVPFRTVSIGGFEDLELHTVGNDLWIQSCYCRDRGAVWYRLGKPSREYQPYHDLFLWVANLAKHFVDYLQHNDNVTLSHFQRRFREWLWDRHAIDFEFGVWIREIQTTDFRQAIVAHGPFLYGQAISLDAVYGTHRVWGEIGLLSLSIVPEQPEKMKSTVVTPYTYMCFEKMPWVHHLKTITPDSRWTERRRRLLYERGFVSTKKRIITTPPSSQPVMPGDIVAIRRDDISAWKGNDMLWFAYVQHISNERYIGLIWLYRPTDTVCADLTYPSKHELFLSDHCNCEDSKVNVSEVIKRVSITLFSNRPENTDFYIRQTYHSNDESFRTLRETDFQCKCSKTRTNSTSYKVHRQKYSVGDTVLVETSHLLEPVLIMELNDQEVKVRELLRRSRDFGGKCCPNELVFTERFRNVHVEQIQRHCHIRFFSEYQKSSGTIPPPYSRDGTGNLFYIIYKDSPNGLLPMTPQENFRLGFDPLEQKKKLRGLNLFSGGGSFDRGLEEGTAVKSEWAVEWGLHQMLTYRANHGDPESLKLFRGSVNDYLRKGLRGSTSRLIAQPGEVDFISGGSPCQGYSLANTQKQSESSLRNCSMIASVVAYVDFYRPQYAILENVPAMSSKTHFRNPLSQLICAFVGMGYQLRLMQLDAWSYGAPQSRSRLFLLIAAPGLKLPKHPPLTHSHPQRTTLRSLGEAPNGLPFGQRRWDTPVYDFVSAETATKDLPSIGSARIMSIPFPDHRQSGSDTRNIIEKIPKYPRMMGVGQSFLRGYVDTIPYSENAKINIATMRAWSRIDPDHLMPTITTTITPHCKFTGRWLHWQENRLITVMEARRAQGYPDDEVIIGRPAQQWQIVGNSVSRHVALALGLSIREACLQNPPSKKTPEEMDTIESVEFEIPQKKRKRRSSAVMVETTTTVTTKTTRTTRTYLLEETAPSAECQTSHFKELPFEDQREASSGSRLKFASVTVPTISSCLSSCPEKTISNISDDDILCIP